MVKVWLRLGMQMSWLGLEKDQGLGGNEYFVKARGVSLSRLQ